MTRNALLAALALALVAGIVWVASGGLARGPLARETAGGTRVEALNPAELSPVPRLAPPAPAGERTARAPLAEEAATASDPFNAALCGVTGRLIEADGRPAAGEGVVLLEVRLAELAAMLDSVGRELPAPALVVARARSGADGRFLLEGAWPASLHALAGSAASPRVPLRVIAEALAPGTRVELGDVVLRERAALAGRVVDERGAPLGGVRVRAGALPSAPAVLALGLAHLRPDGAFLTGTGERFQVIPVPPWLARLEEHLGLATATSAADGSFELDDIPAGSVVLVADRRGFASAWKAETPLEPGERRALDDVVLADGATLRGRVLDAGGAPVRGAQVLAGRAPGWLTVLLRGAPTDAQGCFEVRGLPVTEEERESAPEESYGAVPLRGALVVARPDALSPWTLLRAESGYEELELRLPPRGTLVVRVVGELESPLAASIELTPDSHAASGPFAAWVPRTDFGSRIRELGPGCFVVEGLPLGMYSVLASAPGRASRCQEVELDEDRVEVTVRLERARAIAVQVVDARSGRGVSRAAVSLPDGSGDGVLAHARTDAAGKAVLELMAGAREPGILRAEHPAYAVGYAPLLPQATSADVPLSQGGSLRARLVPAPAEPQPVLLFLTLREAAGGIRDEMNVRLLRFGTRGEGVLGQLPPGSWRYERIDGWPRDAHLFALLFSGNGPHDSASGTFEVREGEATELEIPWAGAAGTSTPGSEPAGSPAR